MPKAKRSVALFLTLALAVAGLLAAVPTQAYACSISLDKRANNESDDNVTVGYGDQVTYTYKVTVSGGTLTDISVTDDVLGPIGTLPSLSGSYTWTVTSSALYDDVTNKGTAIGYNETHQEKDTDDVTVHVKQPSIKLDKTASPLSIDEGQTTTYKYKVSNDGDYDLTNVTVTDDKIAGTIGGPTALAKGDSITFTKVSDPLFEDVTNTGTAAGTAVTPAGNVPVSDTDTAAVCVKEVGTSITVSKTAAGSWSRVQQYVFGIAKQANPDTLNLDLGASGEVTYDVTVTSTPTNVDTYGVSGTITVTNTGDVATKGLTIVDVVQRPNWVDYVSTAVDTSAKPNLGPGESYAYPYSQTFAKYGSVTHYRNEARVTISNHSGPGGPGPHTTKYDADFDLPASPSGTTYAPPSVSLSDVETGPSQLQWTVTSVKIGGVSQADLNGPWTLNPPYVASLPVEIKKSVTGLAVGDYTLHDVAAVDGAQATEDVLVHVIGHPGIAITKAAAPNPASVGDAITYIITVSNTGDVPLTNVLVSDAMLGIVNLNIGDLIVGASYTLSPAPTYTVKEGDLPGPLSNTASATCDQKVNASDTEDILLEQLSIDKSASVATAQVGDVITYTFAVTNGGGADLTGVTVSDPRLGFTWNIGNLAHGDSASTTLPYTVTAGDLPGPIVNTATVHCDQQLTASDTATVDLLAIAITKTANVAAAEVGDVITYTFAVTNSGSATLTGVTVSDPRLGFTWSIGDLAAGATVSNDFAYTVTAEDLPGPLDNIATVSTNEGPGDSSTVSTGIASIAVAKTAEPLTVTLGNPVTYTYVVSNTGSVSLTDVSVLDDVLGTITTGRSLGVGESITLTVTSIPSATVTNTATATGTYAPEQTVSASDSATVTVNTPVGPAATGVIMGHKWNDLSGNGAHEAGEPGLSGVTITLAGAGASAQTTTLTDGSYAFTGLDNGSYTVEEIVPTNMNAMSPASLQVTIVNGETVTDVDFNNMIKQAVGPTVTPTTTTTPLPTTGMDMLPWLLLAGGFLLLGLLALAAGLFRGTSTEEMISR